MEKEFKIEVFKREVSSKKSSLKILRKEMKIPGVYYSHNSTDSTPLYITKKSLIEAQKTGSRIFNIAVNNKKRNIILKSIQYHPVTDEIIHLDLYGVDMKRAVAVSITISLIGTAIGVQEEGGVLVQSLNQLDIECLPLDIPEIIEVDISHLGLGDSIKVLDIEIDEKFTLKTDKGQTIASVTHAMKEEEVVVEVDEESEEFIEGEESDTEESEETKESEDGKPKDDTETSENKQDK